MLSMVRLRNGSLGFSVFTPQNYPLEFAQFKVGEMVSYTYCTQLKTLYNGDSDYHTFEATITAIEVKDTFRGYAQAYYRLSVADIPENIAPSGSLWDLNLFGAISELDLLSENLRLPSAELTAYLRQMVNMIIGGG